MPAPFADPCDSEALKRRLADMLRAVFADPGRIPEFFTDDYEQVTDGERSDRVRFEAHIRHVAGSIRSIEVTVLDAVRQGDAIADRHVVEVVDADGHGAAIEVYLFGTLRGGRLARVSEVTRVLSGDPGLRDLARAAE
ncbi:nuclear transport factor 2 family protein [Inquilinus limosus]|uniref:nuclear transport factor 2 family protein n=1 Tax=Inquilinus limosus TaxID=171674 RepID=UPI00068D710D|nr:nuclear transport factor 2 family protein [Inquilinus limosus]